MINYWQLNLYKQIQLNVNLNTKNFIHKNACNASSMHNVISLDLNEIK